MIEKVIKANGDFPTHEDITTAKRILVTYNAGKDGGVIHDIHPKKVKKNGYYEFEFTDIVSSESKREIHEMEHDVSLQKMKEFIHDIASFIIYNSKDKNWQMTFFFDNKMKGYETAVYGRKGHRDAIEQLENSVRKMF